MLMCGLVIANYCFSFILLFDWAHLHEKLARPPWPREVKVSRPRKIMHERFLDILVLRK